MTSDADKDGSVRSMTSNADKDVTVHGMTFDDISKLAAKNERPESGMTYIDYLAWYILRDIYRDFRSGLIDRERGEERKREALTIWESESQNVEQCREQIFRVAELWKRIESASSAYQLDRTLENADKLIYAIYRVMPMKQEDSTAVNEQTA